MSAVTLSVEEETVAVASVEANPILGTYKRAPMEHVKGESKTTKRQPQTV